MPRLCACLCKGLFFDQHLEDGLLACAHLQIENGTGVRA